jgi:hypothetical protein
MRLSAPATRVTMRLVSLVAVWTVPLTGRPCICQQASQSSCGSSQADQSMWKAPLPRVAGESLPATSHQPDTGTHDLRCRCQALASLPVASHPPACIEGLFPLACSPQIALLKPGRSLAGRSLFPKHVPHWVACVKPSGFVVGPSPSALTSTPHLKLLSPSARCGMPCR